MASILIPERGEKISGTQQVAKFLAKREIRYEWCPVKDMDTNATDEEITNLYKNHIGRWKEEGGFEHLDIVRVGPDTENLKELRQKFIREHTHDEDEVRFFVAGKGHFWFHLEGETFCVRCKAGDFLSVPANKRHWFDLTDNPHLVAVRFFTNKSGWVPHYTDSGIEISLGKMDSDVSKICFDH